LEAERWLAHHGIGESPILETAEGPVPATPDQVEDPPGEALGHEVGAGT
jgi:hypothetical protein